MNEKERVTHPSHYEKGKGHTECIYLLSMLTERFSGIYAGCVMQAKYLYRAGSKAEKGIGVLEKTIEDIKKFKFYWEFASSMSDGMIASMKPRYNEKMEEVIIKQLVEEFTFDKPSWAKEYYQIIIENLIKLNEFENIDAISTAIEDIIERFEEEVK